MDEDSVEKVLSHTWVCRCLECHETLMISIDPVPDQLELKAREKAHYERHHPDLELPA